MGHGHRWGIWRWTLVAIATVTLAPQLAAHAAEEPAPNPYFEDGATPGSGIGKRIGYISLGEALPFPRLVTASVIEQAAVAGADLVVCDSRTSFEEAVVCARQLAAADVDGVLNFQVVEDGAPDVCAAYGDLPTIAIDIHQPPCEVAFMGVDNRQAGLLVGSAMGEHVRRELDCAYDSVVVLGAGDPGQTTRDRMDAALDGFSSVCGPIPEDRVHHVDVGGTTFGDEFMTSYLRSAPTGGIHVVFAVNDDTGLGALRAARALGREGEILIGGQGTDPTSWESIACAPQWIADVAYFPERYGRTLIPAMIDLLDGKDIPAELLTPHVAVDAGNIRELYPETPACP